jgi:ribonuclease D
MHKSITKEEISELPLSQFDGEILVVDRPEDVKEVARELSSEKVLGFDTETKPSFKKGKVNQVALLQLATSQKAYLIRINRTGLKDGLLKVLTNPSIKKVGVGIRDDIRALRQLNEFEPGGFLELQDYAKQVGLEDFSLKKLAGLVMQVRISKKQRLSNWEADELTEPQLVYAATDAWAAVEIFNGLQKTFPNEHI